MLFIPKNFDTPNLMNQIKLYFSKGLKKWGYFLSFIERFYYTFLTAGIPFIEIDEFIAWFLDFISRNNF